MPPPLPPPTPCCGLAPPVLWIVSSPGSEGVPLNAFTLSFGAPAAPLPLDGPPFAADGSEGVLLNAFTLFLGTLAVGALTFGMLLGTLTFGTLAVGTLTFGMLVGTLTLGTLAVGTLTFGMLVGTLTLGTLAVGTLTFGMLVGTLTLGTLTVGTFAPPALARSAPTTTAQRATETLTSFVAPFCLSVT